MGRRLIFSFLVLLGASLSFLPASADAALLAHGTLTFTVKEAGQTVRSCTAVSVVQFANSGSSFLLTEATPAGQQPGTPPACVPLAVGPYFTSTTVRQCTPNGGVVIPGSSLTVAANVYTIRSPYTTCAGKNATDTITLTVSSSSVLYRHVLTNGSGGEINVAGTLTRVV